MDTGQLIHTLDEALTKLPKDSRNMTRKILRLEEGLIVVDKRGNVFEVAVRQVRGALTKDEDLDETIY